MKVGTAVETKLGMRLCGVMYLSSKVCLIQGMSI